MRAALLSDSRCRGLRPQSPSRSLLAFLALLGSSACSGRMTPAHLPWVIHWKGQNLECGRVSTDPSLVLDDLRFFIHDIRLVDAAGREKRVAFIPDGRWQTEAVSLLDFAPDCRKPRAAHSRTDLLMPEGQWTTLRFRLGVPGALKRAIPQAGTVEAMGPLSWSARDGFRSLKIEAHRGNVPVHVALGENGCEELFTDGKECNGPRLADISVPWGPGPVVVELSDLIDTNAGAETVSCLGAADSDCARTYASLGSQFHKGMPDGALHQ